MLRYATIFAAMIALVHINCANPRPTSDDQASVLDRDRKLKEERAAWYESQMNQDCLPGPYDHRAIEAVRRVHEGDKRQFVYGPKDPYNRRAPVLQNLRTKLNSRGEGVLVLAWKDANRNGSADYSRTRSVWLFLDNKIYPVNSNAANDLGRLYDGIPADIQVRVGLTHSYERGQTMLDQLGIEEYTSERRFSGGNPFPMCE